MLQLFRQLIDASQATRIRAQTNDRLLLLMLYDCATDIIVENVLFADGAETTLPAPAGALERKAGEEEEWRIVDEGQIAAERGPAVSLQPAVCRHLYGGGRDLSAPRLWELPRAGAQARAYTIGNIPAARCNADNAASRRTLERAGMLPCGRILRGEVV